MLVSTEWRFYIFDPGLDQSIEPPLESDLLAGGITAEIRSYVEGAGGKRELRMPEVCAGGTVGLEFALSALSSIAATGIIWLGKKLAEFFKLRGHGASGDVNALMLVAIYHLAERHPEVEPDVTAIESLGDSTRNGPAREIRAVYLFRIRDVRSMRVFLMEVSSTGELVTLIERHQLRW
jgi:hypothetical protein